MTWQAKRYHDFSAGHRVHMHESKCRHLHGHNYRVHFSCEADKLDHVGRVIDFSDIKTRLCDWLEENWDHKFLAWEQDPVMKSLCFALDVTGRNDSYLVVVGSIVWVPFNPTAENMAEYLVNVIGPQQLQGTGIRLVYVEVEETRKCSATYSL